MKNKQGKRILNNRSQKSEYQQRKEGGILSRTMNKAGREAIEDLTEALSTEGLSSTGRLIWANLTCT